ncbi:MAG: hypothetical protein WB626_12150 [Bacteroidota bacterium]
MTVLVIFLLLFLFNGFKFLFWTSGSEQAIRLASVGSDFVLILLAFVVLLRRRGVFGGTALVALALVSTVTLIYNLDRDGMTSHLNGLREPAFFLSSLVVADYLMRSEVRERFVRVFQALLLLFCLAQIPSSFVQFLEYGASDSVGGTLGWGATNAVTLLMFMCAFYFILVTGSTEEADSFKTGRVLLFCVLLIPCAINETKISFFLLPVFLGLLVLSRQVHRAVPTLFLGVALVYLLGMAYTEYVGDWGRVLDDRFLQEYLFHTDRETGDYPRGMKLSMSLDIMARDPITFLIGLGYGTLMGGNIIDSSQFTRSIWWIQGARAFLNTVLFQGGIALALLLALPMLGGMRTRVRLSPNMKRFRLFLLFTLGAMWFYHDSAYNRAFAAIVAYFIAWIRVGGIHREEGDAEAEHSELRETPAPEPKAAEAS